MRYLRLRGKEFEFDLRAIDHPNNSHHSLQGIVRMNATESCYKLRGLCQNFELDSSPEKSLILERAQLFFYGPFEDLTQNFFGQVPPELLSYSLTTPHSKVPYYQFPLSAMKLRQTRNDLVDELIVEANSKLPKWLATERIKVELKLEERMTQIKFERSFNVFPEELRQCVLEKGYYYTLHVPKSGNRYYKNKH